MKNKKTVSNIAELRKRLGLTQAELADQVGVSENTIANWERGGASRWIRNLNNLCHALGCQLEDINPDSQPQEDIPQTLNSNTLDVVENYCKLLDKGEKKAAAKIASFATLHDKQLKYWLDHAEKIVSQSNSKQSSIDCDAVVAALTLQNLLIQLNDYSPNEIKYETFCKLIKDTKLSRIFLDKYVSFNEKDYVRSLIFQTNLLTVYIIGWKPNQQVYLHHHGNTLDGIKVIQGEMKHWLVKPEKFTECNPAFEGSLLATKYEDGEAFTFCADELVFIDRRHAHQIENASNEDLVTLHFRFGTPPDDDGKWEKTETDQDELFVWEQIEKCRLQKSKSMKQRC